MGERENVPTSNTREEGSSRATPAAVPPRRYFPRTSRPVFVLVGDVIARKRIVIVGVEIIASHLVLCGGKPNSTCYRITN